MFEYLSESASFIEESGKILNQANFLEQFGSSPKRSMRAMIAWSGSAKAPQKTVHLFDVSHLQIEGKAEDGEPKRGLILLDNASEFERKPFSGGGAFVELEGMVSKSGRAIIFTKIAHAAPDDELLEKQQRLAEPIDGGTLGTLKRDESSQGYRGIAKARGRNVHVKLKNLGLEGRELQLARATELLTSDEIHASLLALIQAEERLLEDEQPFLRSVTLQGDNVEVQFGATGGLVDFIAIVGGFEGREAKDWRIEEFVRG